MVNIYYWVDSLTRYEMFAFISWFSSNGAKSPDESYALLEQLTSGINLQALSLEDIKIIIKRGQEAGLNRIPEPLQFHISIAFARLIQWCFEDDIHEKSIDLVEYRKQLTDLIEPLGINTSFVFSIAFFTKEISEDKAIEYHKNRWPFSPYKLDHLHTLLVEFQFIEPCGHFKDMFLVENPTLENRIKWLKNRTDLVYLAKKLYYKVYKERFLDIANLIFCLKRRNGDYITLRDLKKTHNNIAEMMDDDKVKQANWRSIDTIIKLIPL